MSSSSISRLVDLKRHKQYCDREKVISMVTNFAPYTVAEPEDKQRRDSCCWYGLGGDNDRIEGTLGHLTQIHQNGKEKSENDGNKQPISVIFIVAGR